MYNQSTAVYINEMINRSINDINNITNIYIKDIRQEASDYETRLIIILTGRFSAFLSNYLDLIEKIIHDNNINTINYCTIKLQEIERSIVTQYRYLEVQMQNGLSKSFNVDNYKMILENIKRETILKFQSLEKDHVRKLNNDLTMSFSNSQNQVAAYFTSIGLVDMDICNEIRQIIDIHQYNLLDEINNGIPSLFYHGGFNVNLIGDLVMNRMSAITSDKKTINNKEQMSSVYKI